MSIFATLRKGAALRRKYGKGCVEGGARGGGGGWRRGRGQSGGVGLGGG